LKREAKLKLMLCWASKTNQRILIKMIERNEKKIGMLAEKRFRLKIRRA